MKDTLNNHVNFSSLGNPLALNFITVTVLLEKSTLDRRAYTAKQLVNDPRSYDGDGGGTPSLSLHPFAKLSYFETSFCCKVFGSATAGHHIPYSQQQKREKETEETEGYPCWYY